MGMTILFVAFMAFLIRFSTDRWWLWFVLIMGVAAQFGYKVGIVGIAVWIGISKVLKDIFSRP